MRKGNFIWTDKSQTKVEFVEDPTGQFIVDNILPQYKTCHGRKYDGTLYAAGIDPVGPTDLATAFGFAIVSQVRKDIDKSKMLSSTVEDIPFPELLTELWNLRSTPIIEEIEVTPKEFFRTEFSPFAMEPFIAFKDMPSPVRTIPEVYRFRMFLKETRKRSKLNVTKYRRNERHS